MSECWIGVVSRSHVRIGVAGGFVQLGHGKASAVRRLAAGDRIAIYSPRTDYPDGKPLQAFTALGVVATGEVYQVEMAPDFKPFRVDVRFGRCREAPIRPLIEHLSFIKDKVRWGAAFRYGQLKVPEADLRLIAGAMACRAPDDAG